MSFVASNIAMAHTDNMIALLRPTHHTTHSRECHFNLPGSQPTWPPHPDLSGFMCNIGASLQDSFTILPQKPPGQDYDTIPVLDQTFYLSPPPTGSEPKRTVPLPCEIAASSLASTHIRSFGGVLDSPVVVAPHPLKPQTLPSPPPTIPTHTSDLPSSDGESWPSLDQHRPSTPLTVSVQPGTNANLPDTTPQLLSPLSPEWETTKISDPSAQSTRCVLLSNSEEEQVASPGSFNATFDRPVDDPSFDGPFSPLLQIDEELRPSENPWFPKGFKPFVGDPMDVDCEDPLDPFALNIDHDMPSSGKQPADKIFSLLGSPSIHSLHSLPDLDDIPPSYSPYSPSRRSFSSLPDLDMQDDDLFHSLPSSPGRPLLSLPGAETDDDLLPAELASPNFIPESAFDVLSSSSSRSLLLLDDPNDIPPPRSPSPENFDLDLSAIAGCSDPDLQKLCDLRKRSQAAERNAKQVEAHMLEHGSVHTRAEVRRAKKREKERSREVSALLRLKLGDRIVVPSTDEQRKGQSPKKTITSMAQLVARMTFRRHDASRPLANRQPLSRPHHYVRSPLSQSVELDPAEGDSGSSHFPHWPFKV